jgi:4-amino-4-deoxy-L-arabinose transferase-like glycosyltransferase
MRSRGLRTELALIGLITLGAAVLRLYQIGKVPPDPFYDAAVRSMGLSWHNFFFGAFEPGASVSIDKPPVDLWLQVISVKLIGFSNTSLKLPEALAGTASVPLLYAAVRRIWSPAAGIAAAAALAVLPVEVITSRSDTMDAVMMCLLVIALLLVVRAIETGSDRWLLAGAVTLGIAFDVKLLESLVALPGLAAMAYLGLPASRRRRVVKLVLAGVVYVVVALAWLTATLLVPSHDRPWAIGSTDGSAWNAAFVFNGTDRIGSKSPEPGATVYEPGHRYPVATQSERDHIPIVPPSPTRLLARIGPLSGQRLGLEVLIGLLLGLPALAWGLRAARRPRPEQGLADTPVPSPLLPSSRMYHAAAGGLGLWMLTGLVLFSHMERLHPRYVEGFTPAVAALLGIGLAWSTAQRSRLRAGLFAFALLITIYYAERLLYGRPAVWWVTLAAGLGAIALIGLWSFGRARAGGARAKAERAGSSAEVAETGAEVGGSSAGGAGPDVAGGGAALRAGAVVLSLVAILAVGLKADVVAIHDEVSDAGFVGALPGNELQALSGYLRAHNGRARYEVAAESATQIGALIVKDAKPIVVLTTYNARVFTSIAKLQRLIAAGAVRYAFLNSYCTRSQSAINAACAAPVRWIRAHGTDVSHAAGLRKGKVLYLLPGARP